MSKPISVGDFTRLIKNSLENNQLLQSVWIEGEISNFRAPASGHWYFTLKDSHATLRCVMFKSRIRSLQGTPNDGMKVAIHGGISVFEKDGQYQCYVDRWLPAGIGDLAAAYEKLKEAFRKEGLFDPNRKSPLPDFPKKIGLITSETGAAVQDMVRVATRRHSGIHLVLCPVRVQGSEAPLEIARGIEKMDLLGCDALIVGRGGGSLEELWAFNEEVVVRAISKAKTPIISAVGHESDTTLADYVADVRAATPSQAMELLIPDQQMWVSRIRRDRQRSIRLIENILDRYDEKIRPIKNRLQREINLYMIEKRRKTETLIEKADRFSLKVLEEKKSGWGNMYLRLKNLDPYQNLARGYSFVEDANGQVLTDSSQVDIDSQIAIQLAKGRLIAIVKERE